MRPHGVPLHISRRSRHRGASFGRKVSESQYSAEDIGSSEKEEGRWKIDSTLAVILADLSGVEMVMLMSLMMLLVKVKLLL